MKLSHALDRQNNNLDLFRLIAAGMVIYGHAFALAPGAGHQDLIGRTLGFDYSGSLAVKIFFFLSGIVVTNSLMEKGDPLRFAVARFFRIWPAFLLTIVTSALLIGPSLTDLSLPEYLRHPETHSYIRNNAVMDIRFNLPGVFQHTPYKHAVNGSIWSIPIEIGAYIMLLGLFMTGLLKHKPLALAIFCLIILDPLVGNTLLFTWLKEPELRLLAPCFAFGAVLSLFKRELEINVGVVTGTWLLYYLFRHGSYNFYFFYAALFLSIIHLSTTPAVMRLRPKADISYGVYLWGFPVQQIMASHFAEYGPTVNQLLSLPTSILLGLLSWHMVEKHGIRFGNVVGRRMVALSPR